MEMAMETSTGGAAPRGAAEPNGAPTVWEQTPAAGARPLEDAGAAPEDGGDSVPVYVMLPLDTVNADGVFRYASSRWFNAALEQLKETGIHGVAVDVWVSRRQCAQDLLGRCAVRRRRTCRCAAAAAGRVCPRRRCPRGALRATALLL
jgi:hypothetical protein